ncbi:MAG: hypothetical protein WCT23_07395 [Candidatus Neomarinimicrobiota bacterium]|jgi:hypothetical protein
MKNKILSILTLSLLSVFAFAQDLPDVIAPFKSYNFDNQHFNSATGYDYPIRVSSLNKSGVLSTAIGNATVASGRMIPEFTLNPANLAMNKFSSIQVNGLFTNYNGMSKNSLGGISYLVSVPVYSGSMSFAAGVNKEKDFNQYYQNDDILQKSYGGIYSWHFNGAMEVQEDIYLGAEVSLLSGSRHNDIDFKDPLNTTDGYIEENTYFGASAKIGLSYHPFSILNIGLSIDLPTVINDDYSLRTYQTSGSSSVEYSMSSPAVIRAGLSLNLRIVDLYYSYDYTNWQDMKFRSRDLMQTAVDELNREISNNLSTVGAHHLGMAFHVPMLPLHFYFGYQYLPDSYQGLNSLSLKKLIPKQLTDRFSSSTSWGASFFLKQGLSLSASFETYHLFYDEVEKAKTTNLAISYFF